MDRGTDQFMPDRVEMDVFNMSDVIELTAPRQADELVAILAK